MKSLRWIILVLNVVVIALICYTDWYFAGAGFFDKKTLPRNFFQSLERFIPAKPPAPPVDTPKNYTNIVASPNIKVTVVVVEDNKSEEIPKPTGLDLEKLKRLVAKIESVLYDPSDTANSGAYLTLGSTRGTVVFFRVNDPIIYGDTYKDEDFWLESVEKVEGEQFQLVFRDKDGNKAPLDYSSENKIEININPR